MRAKARPKLTLPGPRGAGTHCGVWFGRLRSMVVGKFWSKTRRESGNQMNNGLDGGWLTDSGVGLPDGLKSHFK